MDRIDNNFGTQQKCKFYVKTMTEFKSICYNNCGGNSMFLPERRQEHE